METCPVCTKPLERQCAIFMTIAACTGCPFKEVVSAAPMPPETYTTTDQTVVFNFNSTTKILEAVGSP